MLMFATLLIGYSLFSAMVIALTHFGRANYQGLAISRMMGMVLLATLVGLQSAHFLYLWHGTAIVHSAIYRMLLFTVAPSFYLFSRPLLLAEHAARPWQWGHLLPILLAPWIAYRWALPLSFAVGAGYLIWLARCVYALRAQRQRFQLELLILSVMFVIALLVFGMGLSLPVLGEETFYQLYASAIGGALLLAALLLGMTPRISTEIIEVARETYAVSTLNQVDCDVVLTKLEELMQQAHLYQNSELDLATLAQQVGLTSHQLSELINTRLGKHFSRYLREYRIEAAKQRLLNEPTSSVLSVGLSVGYTSQSNFYDAFREITGMTPGQYRKIHLIAAPK